jgi:hypothetical protein
MENWLSSEFARFAAVSAFPAGCAFLARGVHIWRTRRATGECGTAGTLSLARGLRAVLVGGALIACAAGVFLESSVLFAIGLAIGAEELLETSAVIFALRDDLARRTLSENVR